ncbi:cellulase family glycosylhydrolase [Cellvibrio sp. OA-2007]|uniref:cellulase family glycosylhydrolase n=1 Tax=Cellvibrio sp. OA-2007 TaxID=529823 RepID=UPI0007816426|nr:cellulase family glycosylhydrolase [Cellvibrio sp. OA-2007]
MSSFKASAITPRLDGALTRSLYAVGFSLAVSTLSTAAHAGCQYVINNQWNNGFDAKIRITNDGTSTINGWNINWQYSGDNRVTSSYNATLTGTNPYSATNLSWNGTIAPNQTVEFGFQGSKGAAAAQIPTITGAVCGGTTTSSVAPASSSTPSSIPGVSSSRSSVSSNGTTQGVAPLVVQGNKVTANGQPANLAGMSLFWSNTGWGGEKYYTAQTVSWLKSDWKANLVRVAMGVEDAGGYLTDASNKARATTVIDAAIANNMYVIIDWHTHHAEDNKAQAITFFKEMATKYGNYNNVIYEVYNEPLNISWSGVLKPYATDVIKEIRAIDPDNLIIVGTPNWSQDVDVAANDPITAYSNIAYTLHFYAGTHKQSLRDKAQTALNRGIALFVTEWGSVNADGGGAVNTAETNTWLSFLKTNGISHANWALNDKAEGSSALVPNASANGGWTAAQLTASGTLVRNNMISQNSGTTSSVAPSSVAPSSSRSSTPSSVAPSSVAPSSVASSVNNGAGVLFSETFESGAVNTQPSGWENFIGWVPNNSNTTSGAQYALIDSAKSYSGSKSIHFKGGAAPAQIIRALPAGTQRLYTRAYVNMSVAMGNVAGDNHEHILGLKKTKDANDEIRVGQIKGVLGTNHIPSDNIAPKMSQWYSGPQMAANTWYCVEVDYLADQAYDTLKMRVNGNEVHSITSANDWNNGALGADWMSDKFNYVMFGFHSFSGRSADVWMDDIVVSTQPIGCGATPPPASSSAPSSVAPSSSSAPSSVAPSSSAPSSVAPSSSAPSSVAPSSSSRSSSSVATTAAWTLDTTASYLNFVTTKNTHVVEVHNFTSISGDISAAGVATLNIDLSTVNTGIALRDQRMRDLLFEVTSFPSATVTVAVPATLISSLAVGQSATTDISANLNLHGVTGAITTKVSVQKLSANRVLVQSLSPILIKAGDYALTDGVEALRAAVGIASISVAVPVDFALVFDAR